jgi:hypothetical protein
MTNELNRCNLFLDDHLAYGALTGTLSGYVRGTSRVYSRGKTVQNAVIEEMRG